MGNTEFGIQDAYFQLPVFWLLFHAG